MRPTPLLGSRSPTNEEDTINAGGGNDTINAQSRNKILLFLPPALGIGFGSPAGVEYFHKTLILK
jgi:hypothetical protein